jgi:hypothetical protein
VRIPPLTTSVSIDVQILDDDGVPVLGLLAADFPELTWSPGGAGASTPFPALSDLASLDAAFVAGGVKERTGGWYRLDCPNEIFVENENFPRIIGEEAGLHLLHDPIEVTDDIKFGGARVVTITAKTPAGLPARAASVRVTQDTYSEGQTTPSNGIVLFSLNDGTYILSGTKEGLQFTPVEIEVDATHTAFTLQFAEMPASPAADPVIPSVSVTETFTNGDAYNTNTRPGSLKLAVYVSANTDDNAGEHMAYRLCMSVEETSNADPNIFVYESVPTAAGRDPNQTRFVTVATPAYMQELPLLEPSVESSYMFRKSTVDLYFRTVLEATNARDRIIRRVQKLYEGMEALATMRRQMEVVFEFDTDEPYSSIVA